MWYDALSELGTLLAGAATLLGAVMTHFKKNLRVTNLVPDSASEVAICGGLK
ncbi:hypothetical protein ACUXV3_01420 [Roseobacteraceae bacterium NS-SX3]